MIINLSTAQITLEAAQALSSSMADASVQNYPVIDLSHNLEREITLLNLDADGKFQEFFEPTLFAQQLIAGGLSKNVQIINLIVSDVLFGKSMITIAQRLCNALDEKGVPVTIRISADLDYITYINPPSANNRNWQIYGILPVDYVQDFTHPSYELLMQCNKKKMLWEGMDLLAWLRADKNRLIVPKNPKDYLFGFIS